MKLFIKKVILFCSCIVVVFLLCLFFLHKYSYAVETLRLNPNQNILVMGDSQIECALNVGMIKNTYSVAQAGDNHLYSYAQLRSLIQQNKMIDTVILGYNYNNVLKSYDNFYTRSSIIQYKVPKYFSMLGTEELKDIGSYNPKALIVTLPLVLKYNINLFFKRNLIIKDLDLGGYLAINDKLNISENKLKRLTKVEYSTLQRKYLDLILKLCNQRKIKLILLATPIQVSNKLYTREYMDHFNTLKYTNATFYNFSDMKLDPSCFYDIVHLNKKGSAIFTTYFRDSILHHHD